MKHYIGIIIVVALLIASVPAYVLSSDIDDADFYGLILVSNNGTAAPNVATVMTLSSPNLISAEYVDSEFIGCAMRTAAGADAIFMPGYNTNPWCIYVPTISANSSFYNTLYMSASDNLDADKWYFPVNPGMAVTDNANLELGDLAYNIEIYGYFDTTKTNHYLIYKLNSVYLYIVSSGTLRYQMIYNSVPTIGAQIDASVSSGLHKINIIRPSGTDNITMYIDDVSVGTADPGSYTHLNAAGNWAWFSNTDGGTLCIDYCSVNISGTQRGYWSWEYGSSFTDQSGNGNTGTPTFRTTTSDAEVSANLTSFAPISPAQAPAISVTNPGDFYDDNITATASFSTGNVSPSDVPGYAVIEDITTDSGLPGFWLWGILSSCVLAATGVGLSYARKRYGISGGYVTAVIVGVCLIFGFLITTGVFDWWMLWYFAIIGAGIAVASRHIDLGGSTSQHAWIGFLATTFIILTLINRIMEGYLITSAETAFLNDIAFTQAFNVLGVFTMPIINFSFFTEGIPALLRWDYAMFGGQAQILQYLLYSFTAVVSFIIFVIVIGLIYNFFSRIR